MPAPRIHHVDEKEEAIKCVNGVLGMVPPGLSGDDRIPPEVIKRMRGRVKAIKTSLECGT